jgi:DNA-binding CsgD family transcriptional regulator
VTDVMTDEDWELAREVCTQKQLQVLAWHRKGYGYRTIALMFDLSPGTVRDRVKRAQQLLERASRDVAA